MKKKGLTLIELLIAMTLLATIAAVISSVYVTGYKTFYEELTSSTIQSNAQTILDGLITDARNGLLIEQSYLTYTTGPNSIIIKVPALDSGSNILYSGTNMLYDRVIYYYQNNAIHKIIFADPASSRYPKNGHDVILDENILELNFTYDPDQATATLVTATISSQDMVGHIARHITITGQARLRNHI